MTSTQHQRWINAGKPAQLAYPLRALRNRLRAMGYTVYDIGNDAHLDHQPPEDHTPYSETGWPGTSPYGWILAIDIMPPPAGRGLPSLQTLGARLVDDKKAGRAPWVKYINWGPTSNSGAVQDRWTPTYVRRASSDVGHIHLSQRTDYYVSTDFDDYDPFNPGGSLVAGLLDNAERGVTALYTGADPVIFPAPWPGSPPAGFPNPINMLAEKIDTLQLTLNQVLETLQSVTVADVSQEQIDAAVLAAVADLRFETRAVPPAGGA